MASAVKSEPVQGGGHIWTWNLTTADHTGDAIEVGSSGDKCIHFIDPTTGSAAASLEGSNDGTNYLILTDPQGNAITKSADGMEQVMESPRYIRPRLTTVGVGAVWTAVLYIAQRR